jgi:hypothetical protein
LTVNNCQPILLSPAKLYFKIDGERKTFHNKHELKKFIITKPALKKILIGIQYTVEEER